MAAVTAVAPLPIIADESCWDIHDALDVAERGAADCLSIYLAKAGGFVGAGEVVRVAAARKMACDVNGSIRSAIGWPPMSISPSPGAVTLGAVIAISAPAGTHPCRIAGRYYRRRAGSAHGRGRWRDPAARCAGPGHHRGRGQARPLSVPLTMAGYRIAADIGGTFTDIACLSPDGTLTTAKVPTTPGDYARPSWPALPTWPRGLQPADFAEILHASTIATNAILEGKGARTAPGTTEGFRDVLEMRRIRVPRLYDPFIKSPPRSARAACGWKSSVGPRGDDPAARHRRWSRWRKPWARQGWTPWRCASCSYANPAHEAKACKSSRKCCRPRPSSAPATKCCRNPRIRADQHHRGQRLYRPWSAPLGALQRTADAAGPRWSVADDAISGGLLDVPK
jgi:hypothetical protein